MLAVKKKAIRYIFIVRYKINSCAFTQFNFYS